MGLANQNLCLSILFGLITLVSACKKDETAQPAGPTACIQAKSSAKLGTPVTFKSCSTAGVTCNWSFGDGETATGDEVSHLYDTLGNFTVTLTVSNDNGTATKSAIVTITGKTNLYCLGNFIAGEKCTTSDVVNYDITITNGGGDNIELSNFGFFGTGFNPVAEVNGYNITIPQQTLSGSGIPAITISGTGTIDAAFREINIDYTATYDTTTENCRLTAIRK